MVPTRAAEQSDVDAQFNLAILYEKGLGVPQDSEEATNWYRLAAEQGDVDAQFNLAILYEEGLAFRKILKKQ